MLGSNKKLEKQLEESGKRQLRWEVALCVLSQQKSHKKKYHLCIVLVCASEEEFFSGACAAQNLAKVERRAVLVGVPSEELC